MAVKKPKQVSASEWDRTVRRRVLKAFKSFTPSQQAEIKRYGINPTTGKGIVTTTGASAKHVGPTAAKKVGGRIPRIVVGGRAATTSTITHELSHAYLSSKLPRAGKFGMGMQHTIMGVAGDVGEGPDTDTTLVPSRLSKAARQVSTAIQKGATWKQLGGASFRGGSQRIFETKGIGAFSKDIARWKGGGHAPPPTITQLNKQLSKKPPTAPRDPYFKDIVTYGKATTPAALKRRKLAQVGKWAKPSMIGWVP